MEMAKEKLQDVLNLNPGTRAVGDDLKKTGCYADNVGELLTKVGTDFVDVDGDLVTFDFATVIRFINATWSKVKETALECEGKTIQVKLPDGVIGSILAATLQIIGIKL